MHFRSSFTCPVLSLVSVLRGYWHVGLRLSGYAREGDKNRSLKQICVRWNVACIKLGSFTEDRSKKQGIIMIPYRDDVAKNRERSSRSEFSDSGGTTQSLIWIKILHFFRTEKGNRGS